MIATEEDEQASRESWTRRLLWLAGAASLLITARRVLSAVSGQGGIALDPASGGWAALALDFSRGLPYRPLLSEAGYGGTPDFPLHAAVHGLLIRLGLNPALAGHAVALVALALLLGAALVLLRALAVPAELAVAGVLILLANEPLQAAATTVRADLLAAALNVLGLAFAVSARNFLGMLLACVPFALAILTQETAVQGLLAASAALALRGLRRQGIAVVAFAGVLVLLGVLLTEHLSQGRFVEALRAASAGGATVKTLAFAPARMFNEARPSDLALWVLALAGMIASSRAARAGLPGLYLIATGCLTLLLLSSPGAAGNSFLDLDLAAILFLVAEWGSGRLRGVFPAAALALASLAVCGALAGSPLEPQRPAVAQVLAEAGSTVGPLLAENPWLPILSGEAPFLQDAAAAKQVFERTPAARADLLEKVDRGFFRAVVLEAPPAGDKTEGGRAGEGGSPGDARFGPGFGARLLQRYEPSVRRFDRFVVYRPKRR